MQPTVTLILIQKKKNHHHITYLRMYLQASRDCLINIT